MPLLRSFLVLLMLLASFPAAALTLDEARNRGLIGETPQGYVAPVGSPSGQVRALVNEINAGRRAEFQSIAGRTGSTLEQVETVIGQRIYKQVPAGTYLLVNGRWQKK